MSRSLRDVVLSEWRNLLRSEDRSRSALQLRMQRRLHWTKMRLQRSRWIIFGWVSIRKKKFITKTKSNIFLPRQLEDLEWCLKLRVLPVELSPLLSLYSSLDSSSTSESTAKSASSKLRVKKKVAKSFETTKNEIRFWWWKWDPNLTSENRTQSFNDQTK